MYNRSNDLESVGSKFKDVYEETFFGLFLTFNESDSYDFPIAGL